MPLSVMSLSYSNYQWKITQREKKLAGLRSDGERLEQATDFHEHYDRRRRIMGGGRGERGGMYDNLADSPWGEQHPYQEEEVEEGEAADSRTRKTVVRRIIRRRSGDDL